MTRPEHPRTANDKVRRTQPAKMGAPHFLYSDAIRESLVGVFRRVAAGDSLSHRASAMPAPSGKGFVKGEFIFFREATKNHRTNTISVLARWFIMVVIKQEYYASFKRIKANLLNEVQVKAVQPNQTEAAACCRDAMRFTPPRKCLIGRLSYC